MWLHGPGGFEKHPKVVVCLPSPIDLARALGRLYYHMRCMHVPVDCRARWLRPHLSTRPLIITVVIGKFCRVDGVI